MDSTTNVERGPNNTSGVGWSESDHILEVEEAVWQDYVKDIESSASRKGKRVGKRKRFKDVEVEVVVLLSTLCEKADQRWGQIVVRIGVQHDAKEQRKVLYEALKCIPILTTEGRFIVSKYHQLKMNNVERHASMLRIAERYRRPGWSANEERECYRLFFNLCHETPDVNVPAIFNSLWPQLSIQLTEEMLTYFSMVKVKAKTKALHMNFREFLTFLETASVNVHAESSLVTVNSTYWAYVGRYEECVELWDLRRGVGVHIEAGERVYDPIMFYDTDEENVAADDPHGGDGADGAKLGVGNEGSDKAAGLDYMNGEEEYVAEAVEEDYKEEDVAEAAAVKLVDIESDKAPEEMDIDIDFDSCVDLD
ncbi:30S ribosomal protein S15 [Striga asiatica]|uniref:30S ribosomal protein S15 n=1 Tax=Striga asiatica TaxID=4170 RepID=A0A5A7QH47_STRAF|nr:30S ribosomal protein S15 [Striga asiatica]